MEKTIRQNGKWAKVTNIKRNSNCIAVGYAGIPKAHQIVTMPCSFKVALEIALARLND